MLEKLPMKYFVVFSKNGIVEYEHGSRPLYLDYAIREINTKKPEDVRKIGDDTVEYQIEGETVYLSVSRGLILKKLVLQYKKGEIELFNDEGAEISNRVEKVEAKPHNKFQGGIEVEKIRARLLEHLVEVGLDSSLCKTIINDVVAQFKDTEERKIDRNALKQAMGTTIRKLVPCEDHCRIVEKVKKAARVFSIFFVGDRGQEKASAMMRMAHWLACSGIKVLVAVDDTQSPGVIRDLIVLAEQFGDRRRNVGFYEGFGGTDNSEFIADAITWANKKDYDVILVSIGDVDDADKQVADTVKSIQQNNPNHVVFVECSATACNRQNKYSVFANKIEKSNCGRKVDNIIIMAVNPQIAEICRIFNFLYSVNAPVMLLGAWEGGNGAFFMNPVVLADLILS